MHAAQRPSASSRALLLLLLPPPTHAQDERVRAVVTEHLERINTTLVRVCVCVYVCVCVHACMCVCVSD
jgi:hypothetical protein